MPGRPVALAGCSAVVPLTESTSTGTTTIDSASVDTATVTSSDPVSADSSGLGGRRHRGWLARAADVVPRAAAVLAAWLSRRGRSRQRG